MFDWLSTEAIGDDQSIGRYRVPHQNKQLEQQVDWLNAPLLKQTAIIKLYICYLPVTSARQHHFTLRPTFAALDAVRPPRRGSVTYYAKGYDAGTELNDQICANIPGPRCGGEGFNAEQNDRGDFVHINSGMHDIGDLSAATYDWRNPVAAIILLVFVTSSV